MEKNKRSKRNKKILAAAGALACIALLAGTYAWLQSEDEKTNKFTGVLAGNDVLVDETFIPPTEWKPGESVVKEAGALNTGEYDEFVRMTFTEMMKMLSSTDTLYSSTLPILMPGFFDPIKPETNFYGFAVEFNIGDDGKISSPILKDAAGANDTNNLDAFMKFLNAYYGTSDIKADALKSKGDGTVKQPYELDYKGSGFETINGTAGWLVPAVLTAYTQANGWNEATIIDNPEVDSYVLKGFQFKGKDITDPNTGEVKTPYQYYFYWDNGTSQYQAKVDKTETQEDGSVKVTDPKFAYISGAYGDLSEAKWTDKKPLLNFDEPGNPPQKNGTYMGLENPTTNPVTVFPGVLNPGKQLPSAANPDDFGYWQQNSLIDNLTYKDNDGKEVTGAKAHIGIDFINILPTTPKAEDVAKGQGINRWVYNQADGYFYYLNIVESGKKSTNLLNSVKMLGDAGNAYTKVRYNLDVKVEAIQAFSEAAAKEWSDADAAIQAIYNVIGADAKTTNP